MASLTKSREDGGWNINFSSESMTFKAIRNEAGFAGRDWELWELVAGPSGFKYGGDGVWTQVADMLASRKEAVELAESTVAERAKMTRPHPGTMTVVATDRNGAVAESIRLADERGIAAVRLGEPERTDTFNPKYSTTTRKAWLWKVEVAQ